MFVHIKHLFMLVYYLTDLTKNTIYLLIMLQRQVFSNKLFTKIIKKKKLYLTTYII